MTKVTRAVIVGGGIGGAATALSLARLGIKVVLLEKAHEIGEIGAGIQLGPNAFSALDSSASAKLPASARCLPITLP